MAGYKVNIQKSDVFLYTNNKISVRESEKKNCLKLHQNIARNTLNQGGESHALGLE